MELRLPLNRDVITFGSEPNVSLGHLVRGQELRNVSCYLTLGEGLAKEGRADSALQSDAEIQYRGHYVETMIERALEPWTHRSAALSLAWRTPLGPYQENLAAT